MEAAGAMAVGRRVGSNGVVKGLLGAIRRGGRGGLEGV